LAPTEYAGVMLKLDPADRFDKDLYALPLYEAKLPIEYELVAEYADGVGRVKEIVLLLLEVIVWVPLNKESILEMIN
jgi:hypothetical protein